MIKVLITGITGFVGSHLAEYLLDMENIEVYGIVRRCSKMDNIEHIKEKLNLYECDIKDASSVRHVIDKVKPHKIFHLAAQSFVPASFNAPAETLSTNIIGQLNILEAVRDLGFDPIIHIAGSSEEYGLVEENEVPITEDNPLRPLSPSGVSKIAQDLMGFQYHKSFGLRIIRTRAFNHTGPRRPEPFVCSNFARQIALIEKDRQEPVIYTGNLDSARDFTDVRDMVHAYWLATEVCIPGEVYNICSQKAHKIREVLDTLLSFTKIKPQIKIDPQRMRPSDVPLLVGSCKKFRDLSGWHPKIPFEKTLKDILDWWRKKL